MCGMAVPMCMPNFVKISKKTWRQSAMEPLKFTPSYSYMGHSTRGVGNNSGDSDPIFKFKVASCVEGQCQSACQISS